MADNRRGDARTRRIHWTEMERAVVIHQAALVKIDHPKLPWGEIMLRGMNAAILAGELDETKRRPESSLRLVGKSSFGAAILVEVERIVAERMVAHQAKQAERLEQMPAANEPESPVEVSLLPPTRAKAMNSILSMAIGFLGDEFEAMLEEELKTRTSKVFSKMGQQVSAFGAQVPEVKALVKPSIGLVGTQSDNTYFERVAKDLHDAFNFVPIVSLGDTRNAKKCQLVIMSSSAPEMVKTAVKAIATGAEIITGKASSEVHDILVKLWTEYQTGSKHS
jgi:hypothetical protein